MSSKLSSKKKAPPISKSSSKPTIDLMEQFHTDQKICEIISTNEIEKKDVFAYFLPKDKRDYLDYDISQTDAKFDAGATKIHFQQTHAFYQPRPAEFIENTLPSVPIKRKIKPSKGHHGPVQIFEDEVRAAKYEIEQEVALKEMKTRIARKRQHENALRLSRHRKMLKELGPVWFHELSPQQLNAADELRASIHLDLSKGTVNHTQENIGKLGLVLRPNPKHLEIALAYSCGNPVEFLLILYQISNPKRVFYSLNDKLLLSAVAHLSMRETLRELHIRIPSPPEKVKCEGTKKKETQATKRFKGKHKSPYLCSFTFEPTWGRHSQGYRDNHVQYPESPYFDYVDDLKKEMVSELPNQGAAHYHKRRSTTSKRNESEDLAGFFDSPLERELNDELQAAQIKYNELTKCQQTRRLLRPSIYRPCFQCLSKNSDPKLSTTIAKNEDKTPVSLTVHVKITDQYDDNNQHISTKYQYQVDIEESQNVVEENKKEDIVENLPVIDDVSRESCHCLDELGVSDEDSSNSKKSDSISHSSYDDRLKHDLVKVKPPSPWNCTCKKIVQRYVEEVVEKRLDVCRTPTFIIMDIKSEAGEKPIPIIGGVKAEKTCTCLERFKGKMQLFEDRKRKREAQDALKSTKQCYIVNGVCVDVDGNPIYILSGIAEERPCPKCVAIEEFQQREQERLANMPTLPAGRQKYIISGVQQRPEGNVYIVSGVVPIEDCECMRLYDAFVQKHGKCMDLYHRYVQKVKTDIAEYMEEVKEAEKHPAKDEKPDDEECKCEINGSVTPSDEDDDIYCPCEEEISGQEEGDEQKGEDTKIVITVEIGDTEKNKRRKSSFEFDETALIKRFIILKKFTRDRCHQMKILKHSLKVLAMDGYPLAKLPNVHTLPIFKLWMDMRCGKYWTIEDKEKYLNVSKFHLHHTSTYTTNIEYPQHRLSVDLGKRFTWCNAKFVKAYAKVINEEFYRKAKQGLIAHGQKYFPTTCSYEFPTKSFRDCYFAYVPAKEEEVFVFKPWTMFDVRRLFQIRQTLRGRQTC